MKRVLFVCHGNICRSPMAEFVMKDMVRRRGDAAGWEIASAATSGEEIGNPPHRGTRTRLAREGIECGGKRAVRLQAGDYDRYDYIVGMDEHNLREMRRLFGGDPEGKLSLLLDWTGSVREVADPWYTGDFEATYDDVTRGCAALLSRLEEGQE